MRVMARHLAEAGVEVDVVTSDDDGPGRLPVTLIRPVREPEGYTVRYFPRQIHFYTISFPLVPWLWKHVGEYDLVHVHSVFIFPSVAAAAVCAARGVPYIIRPLGVLSPYGMTNRRRIVKTLSFKLVDQPLLDRAEAVHYTSDMERDEALTLGVKKRPVVLPLGVDLSSFREEASPEAFFAAHPECRGRFVILFLSRLDPKKGLDLLFPAFRQVRERHPEALLVIAGSGSEPYEAELRRMAEAAGVAEDVVWTGFLGGEAKRSALAAADLFVLPSYAENFGIAVVEALAAGLPLVLSDQVGVAGEIGAAGAGLVTQCAVEPLSERILQVIEQPDLRRELRTRGRDLAQQRYSSQAMTRGLLELYESVLAGRRASGR